jgi:protein tyrosine phosphatase
MDLTHPNDLHNYSIPITEEEFTSKGEGLRPPLYPKYKTCITDTESKPIFRVSISSVEPNGDHTYQIEDQNKIFGVQAFHYPYWRDRETIPLDQLDLLVDKVLTHRNVGIHCIGGVGRTGTLTTAAFLKEMIIRDRIQRKDFTPEWFNQFIYLLRRQRSKNWLGNLNQYHLVYQYGLWLFETQPPLRGSNAP